MTNEEFKKYGHQLVDWMAEYIRTVENLPVKSQVQPKDVYNKIPEHAPINSELFEQQFKDFTDVILPGITHWQSPNFFAYFTANSSYPSVLGEMLTATMGAQCMIWETSPAAAELEERMVEWLRDAIGLSKEFTGVLQDTASAATLAAIISARERASNYDVNRYGLSGAPIYRVYCSEQSHSSIEKAVKIAGLGSDHCVKITTDNQFAMDVSFLEKQIMEDKKNGFFPLAVVSALGTTGSTAIDPIAEIAEICSRFSLWHHIDAAFAGTALVLPEYQHLRSVISSCDSFVFNPHKWMFTNFDCSAYYVRNPEHLVNTFSVIPEYLRTKSHGKVNNYSDWGVALGRRFRALKLWFVIRTFGMSGIQEKIREHLRLTHIFLLRLQQHPLVEVLAPVSFNLICFRFKIPGLTEEKLNEWNENLLHRLNSTGKIYITHTKLNGKYTLRMVIGQTQVEERHILAAWDLITKTVDEMNIRERSL